MEYSQRELRRDLGRLLILLAVEDGEIWILREFSVDFPFVVEDYVRLIEDF